MLVLEKGMVYSGKALESLRNAKGLSMKKCAEHFGISSSTWHSYEHENSWPPVNLVRQIGKYFGVQFV